MQAFDLPKAPGRDTTENGPYFRVTKRWMLWINYGLPLLLTACLAGIGIRLASIPWNDLWNGSLAGGEAAELQVRLEAFLVAPLIFGIFLLSNRNWFLHRICRYRIAFGPEREVYCSDPELFAMLSPAAFLGTQMLPYTESAVYKTDAASRPLAICGTFDNMVAWADWRFGADTLREALGQITFPRHLQTSRETLAVQWFLHWSLNYIFFNYILVPFAIALLAGDLEPFPGLDAAAFLAAALIASAGLFDTSCTRVALTADGLRFRYRLRSKTIPFDAIREIRLWPNGFTVIYGKGPANRSARISQSMFSESLLPLYFSLCGSIPSTCTAKDNVVDLNATGVPIP